MRLKVTRIRWESCWRIIPAQYPRIPILERLCDPGDLESLLQLEELTNPRIREEIGDLELVPKADRVTVPGASYIMSPFTHPSVAGGRFSDTNGGAYYAGESMATAIQETVHHRQDFWRKWSIERSDFPMRVLVAALDGRMHDIRGRQKDLHDVYDKASYRVSQQFAATLRAKDSSGIVYDSVRRPGGQCVAVFRPRLLIMCRDKHILIYHWDGRKIVGYTPLKEYVVLKEES